MQRYVQELALLLVLVQALGPPLEEGESLVVMAQLLDQELALVQGPPLDEGESLVVAQLLDQLLALVQGPPLEDLEGDCLVVVA